MAADESGRAGFIGAALGGHHLRGRRRATHLGVADLVPGARACGAVVVGSAQGVDAAATPQGTRVAATALRASLVVWTVLIHPAAHNAATADADLFQPTVGIRVAFHRNFSAVNLGVSLEVWRAAALGRVADGLAVCVDATDARTAGILAQPVVALQEEVAVAVRTAPSDTPGVVANLAPVAVVVGGAEVARRALTMNAYVPWQALFVRNTVWVLLAFKLRVPIEAGRAEAVRAMVLWRAVSVDSAGTAEGTRVLALALVTALVDGAVLVSTATVKATVCFADFAERTLVVSCAFHFGYATSIVTRPLCTAVKFPAADIRIPQALRIGVTQRLRRTCAGQSVVESLAVGVQATSPDKLTRVLALTTDA